MKILVTFLLLSLFGCNTAPQSTKKIEETLARICPSDSLYELTILFSGDFMQHTPQITAARAAGNGELDYTAHLSHIKGLWSSTHYCVVNLETTLSRTPPYSGYPMFRSPAEIATALKQSGVTHLALANNHTMDKGLRGVRSTLEVLDSVGVEHFGVGEGENRSLCFIEHGDIKVAILNATYGTNGMPVPRGVEIISSLDTTLLATEIQRAQDSAATHIIAYVHWGNEYQTSPNREQKKLGLWMRNKGVNTVIGSHPHVAQPIDYDNSIVYSLGNFVSNQRKVNTDAGYSVHLRITEGEEQIKITPFAHYVDMSGTRAQRYRVLLARDSTVVTNLSERKRMVEALQRVQSIIDKGVRYD